MIALALDTSGPVGSVAVLGGADDAPQVLATRTIGDGMRHGVDLFPAIEEALRDAGVAAREIELVAVGIGPGSYTGLRVGVTAARAIAYAAGAELLGVPSCDALAAAAGDDAAGGATLAVVVDARVRAVYVALYRACTGPDGPRWERADGPELLPPGEAAARIPAGALVVGDGPGAHADAFAHLRRAERPQNAGAADIARLALARRARGEREAIDAVEPLYLRRTEAERRLDEGGRP